ncbi:hypothetical protein NLX78_22740 [Paenibacillus sp. Lou8.1]|uniref:hypothetical protein n=1 Tax=Paenibacillus sp. Lou8.1 TaxID=2962041 RepID=UPI000F9DC8D9|nr:hypothetical protein [Paenibacillus sp. Lou8.1]MCP3810041.1 hypothetical protein [Paenibacillus sp. Lou8.1]
MAKEILWSENQEFAYGIKAEFINKEDFIATVKAEHEDLTDEECDVVDVEVCTGLYTDETLEAERIILLKYTNVQIENWYVGRIAEPKESNSIE